MSDPLTFEVRMPVCNRPQLLQRALESLRAQDYPYWKAAIFDDSSNSESEQVTSSFGDSRIAYVRNPQRLGGGGNIDRCFASEDLHGGAYGCLLEDDNFWMPEFLSGVVEYIGKPGSNLILVNQRINEEGVGLRPDHETTRGDWFSKSLVDPLDLRASLLFMEGLSNGGVVWRLNSDIDLRVCPHMPIAGLQEACRSLLVKSSFTFISNPLAVYTLMPRAQTTRMHEANRMIGRGMQSVRNVILQHGGSQVVERAKPLATKLGLTSILAEVLAYCGHWRLAGELSRGRIRGMGRALAKGLAIRLVEKDPCAAFLNARQVYIQ